MLIYIYDIYQLILKLNKQQHESVDKEDNIKSYLLKVNIKLRNSGVVKQDKLKQSIDCQIVDIESDTVSNNPCEMIDIGGIKKFF